jgi:peroxiredoxin Q/BCP
MPLPRAPDSVPTIPQLKLAPGDMAPDFTAPGSNGTAIRLSDFRGEYVVLYFYPRDDTPGCTKEACGIRDEYAALKKSGAIVLGVSADSVRSHDKFARKYKLPFTLVADVDKTIAKAYGAWGPKQFLGIKFKGIYRVTFLIDPGGRIQMIWPQVRPTEHAREILAELTARK